MNERPAGVVERLNKRLTVPLAEQLAGVAWITPDWVTWTSAACAGLLAPAALLAGWPLAAAALVLTGAWLDSLDGLRYPLECPVRLGQLFLCPMRPNIPI